MERERETGGDREVERGRKRSREKRRCSAVSRVQPTVFVFEDVEDGKDLPVVRNKSLANKWCRVDELLQNLESPSNDHGVARVQCICNGAAQRRRG